MLRREIDILSRPAVTEPEPPLEEMVEEPPEQVEENMEANDASNGEEVLEEVKNEEMVDKEDDMDDEEGLFSSEFDLMDGNGFQPDMGFDSWMNM